MCRVVLPPVILCNPCIQLVYGSLYLCAAMVGSIHLLLDDDGDDDDVQSQSALCAWPGYVQIYRPFLPPIRTV